MSSPKYIYHYTQINSLALILANRTIRFSALNKLNDLTEGQSADVGDFGMYLFVSCWTDMEKEHLPLWNMYTTNMRGVRIKLPFPIFPTYEYRGRKTLFKEQDMIKENYMILANREPFRRVIYTKDQEKLMPNSIRHIGKNLEGINLDGIGLYKDEIWDFENEIRFFFGIVPKPRTEHINDTFDIDKLTKLIDDRNPLGFNHFDLKLDNKSFMKMEITLGPKILPGDREIIESLIERYNPTAKIHDSILMGRIK